MTQYDLNDTIVAIATSIGQAGIGIVRISGKDALAIADKVFISKDRLGPSNFKTYTMHYGWIAANAQALRGNLENKSQPIEIIDEVILSVMRAPKSYTKEDIVEINCHGGIVVLRKVLDLILENGCRLAQPGEFTKRAFLNGRIDLAQAEAVLDIISAKTDCALKIGVEQLKGALSKQVNRIRDSLINTLSLLEANIDFPEEDIEKRELENIKNGLNSINKELNNLLDDSRNARIFREGIHAVICGKPNVGKSSLLNALLKHERSIVTSIAGTTRDTVEEIIGIKGIPVRLVDTAGILEPRNLVEKKAVQRSKKQIDLADLVIVLFDGNHRLTKDDKKLIRSLNKKTSIAVINKMDLKQNIDRDKIALQFKYVVDISAKRNRNIELLEDVIANLVYKGKVNNSESVMVSNLRHISALKNAQKLIAQALNSLDNKLSYEFVAQDIKDALFYFDAISGRRFSDDLLDKIFSQFCIGK